jgi:hypothetical protein
VIHQDTSIDAYLQMLPKRADGMRSVFEVIYTEGGSSSYDICRRLRWPHQTVTARVRDLAVRGLIVDSGTRRTIPRGDMETQAIVWVPAESVPEAFAPAKPEDDAEFVDQVAGAIFEAIEGHQDEFAPEPWATAPELWKPAWRAAARAAIKTVKAKGKKRR